VLSLQNLSIRAGIKLLFQGANLNVHPGQKIGLIGQNGTGKTTLFKTILGEHSVDEGQVAIPANWLIGSVEQEVKQLDLNALDYVCFGDTKYANAQKMIAESERSQNHDELVKAYDLLDKIDGFSVPNNASQLLYGLGFSARDFEKKISEFSGGWQVRLKLARALMQRSDLLLLDEPTNHLDMDTRDALDMALQDFDGALIIVTHDKHLLASVADQYWWVHQGEVSHFMGDLDAYLQMRLKTLKEQANAAKPQKQGQTKKQTRQASAQIRKQAEARLKPIKKALKKVEKTLEQLQEQQAGYHLMMEDSALYEAKNKEKLTHCLTEQAACEQALERCEMEWLSLQEELETEQAVLDKERV